jgi:hypothetical protein
VTGSGAAHAERIRNSPMTAGSCGIGHFRSHTETTWWQRPLLVKRCRSGLGISTTGMPLAPDIRPHFNRCRPRGGPAMVRPLWSGRGPKPDRWFRLLLPGRLARLWRRGSSRWRHDQLLAAATLQPDRDASGQSIEFEMIAAEFDDDTHKLHTVPRTPCLRSPHRGSGDTAEPVLRGAERQRAWCL